jgi:hypothetical protein
MRATHRRAFKGGSRRRAKPVPPALRAGSKRKRVFKAAAAASTKKIKQKQIKVRIKKTGSLSERETQDIDYLIASSFQNSSIDYIDKSNDCVFVSIGTQVVGAMFLRPVRLGPGGLVEHGYDGANASPTVIDYDDDTSYNRTNGNMNDSNYEKMRDLTPSTSFNGMDDKVDKDKYIYIHTACVSGAHRGKGLLHKLFYFLSTLPRFKHAIFKLEASNTVEHANGLDQAVRFQIYSKAGFTLPIGTVVEPGGETVVGVEAQGQSGSMRQHRDIAYALRSRDGRERVASFRDVRPEACYIQSIKQERGCLMESDSKKMRDFNHG